MSDVVIKANGLGKLYRIGRRERYKTLRESLVSAAAPLRRLVRRGKAAPDPETSLWALRDVSFEIKRGEAVGVIGRNGAGKSTLLKVLSRIVAPTEGEVELTGRVGSLLEVGTGFHPELTGRENIYLNGAILGMRRTEIADKFDEIVAFSEVEKFLDTPVKRYSSGMYMRLAFAVAAHLEPEILVVDEVLAVGDAQFQKKCLGKMGDVAEKKGRTVLFVSHQMGAVAQLCSRTILMREGRVATIGETGRVIAEYLGGLSAETSSVYAAPADQRKDMFVSRALTRNNRDEPSCFFAHDEPVIVDVECRIDRWLPGTVMGFFIRDFRGRKVFTTINDAWPTSDPGRREVSVRATIPAHFLAPGQYALTLAISVPHTQVLDWVEDVVPITVSDAGSEFAAYEGGDYGCVFSPCTWAMLAAPHGTKMQHALVEGVR